jgi:hypothetical protein
LRFVLILRFWAKGVNKKPVRKAGRGWMSRQELAAEITMARCPPYSHSPQEAVRCMLLLGFYSDPVPWDCYM